MVARVTFTAVYEPVENGWVQPHLAELPGVITAAPTQEEARDPITDALREYSRALGRAEASSIPPAAGRTTQAGALQVGIDAARTLPALVPTGRFWCRRLATPVASGGPRSLQSGRRGP